MPQAPLLEVCRPGGKWLGVVTAPANSNWQTSQRDMLSHSNRALDSVEEEEKVVCLRVISMHSWRRISVDSVETDRL